MLRPLRPFALTAHQQLCYLCLMLLLQGAQLRGNRGLVLRDPAAPLGVKRLALLQEACKCDVRVSGVDAHVQHGTVGGNRRHTG